MGDTEQKWENTPGSGLQPGVERLYELGFGYVQFHVLTCPAGSWNHVYKTQERSWANTVNWEPTRGGVFFFFQN